ncbi:MAG: LysR family transcriptional regulator [bacterium]|nr:LysR family transcriptional regulator [bacterium]
MHLSSRQLKAFLTVASTLNFTRAAERLGITQSALSQRVKHLEEELGCILLNRSNRGVQVTDAGTRVLRFCRTTASLEEEFLADLGNDPQGPLKGVIRIAAHSSVLMPVILPVIAPLLRENPLVQCEFLNAETVDLPGILNRGEAEFVIMDHCINSAHLMTHELGHETYIAIASENYTTRENVYLDLNINDHVTEDFFRQQETSPQYKRSFMSDVFGIIAGVEQGLGRAVVSRHLLSETRRVRVLSEFKPIASPVVIHFHSQSSYTRLHHSILKSLLNNTPEILS